MPRLFIPTVFADQITLKDGDRITGAIVKKDGDSVTIRSKNFGTVTLKWADVAAVKSDQPLNITLAGGKTVKANIETQGLAETFRMFNNLLDTGQYRMNADVGAATQLAKWLNWNVSLSDRYLSNTASGRKKNDFLYSTGLGFNRARQDQTFLTSRPASTAAAASRRSLQTNQRPRGRSPHQTSAAASCSASAARSGKCSSC